MPSRMDPSTIPIGEPEACLPPGSFRSDPPRRLMSQSPTAKVQAPSNTKMPTRPTVWVFSASSINS